MFNGTDEELKQTKVTQPAVFLDSVITALSLEDKLDAEMVAGHSLGEFSALVVAGVLSFEDGLRLVQHVLTQCKKLAKLLKVPWQQSLVLQMRR